MSQRNGIDTNIVVRFLTKLGLSRPTVVKLLEEGEIPFDKPGKHRRVRAESLDAYLQKVQARQKIIELMENEGDESGIARHSTASWLGELVEDRFLFRKDFLLTCSKHRIVEKCCRCFD